MALIINLVITILLIIGLITLVYYIWYKLQQFSEFENSLSDVEQEFADRELAKVEPLLRDHPPASQAPSESVLSPPKEGESKSTPIISSENFPYRPKQSPAPVDENTPLTPSPTLPGEDRVQSVEELASRLMRLNIMKDKEGSLPLSIQPHGLTGRLRSGGICALLPRTVGEEDMIHLTKRFDLVFLIGRNGEVLILERYQSRLPQLLDPPGD